MKTCLIVWSLLYFSSSLFGQTWQQLGSGASMSVHCLKVNPHDNKLYVGGWFSKIDGTWVSGLAKYDGNSFSQISNATAPFISDTNSIYASAVYDIDFFNNYIYIQGNLFGIMENYPINVTFGFFDGVDWIGIPQLNHMQQSSLYVDSNRIFLNNGFAGTPYTNYYKPFAYILDENGAIDSLCFPYPISSGATSSIIKAMIKYKGKHYFGGNVNGFDSIAISEDFFDWDGGAELNVTAGGIRGSSSYINCFAEYNDELYLGGYWLQSDGNLSNTIMKYDGTNLKPVYGFGSMNYITDMTVYNNILYMCGNFNDVNGIHDVNNIVYFDGTGFNLLDTLDFNNTITSIEFYNDELYVGGGFQKIGNDSISRIAKYTGILPTSVSEIKNNNNKIEVFYDKNSQLLKILSPKRYSKIGIYNLQGQQILNQTFSDQINVEKLNFGMYLLELKDNSELFIKQWIKY